MPNASIHCLCLNPALDLASVAEKVEPTRKIRVTDQCEFPGGGALNVARVLHTLKSNVKLTYLAGGPYGTVLKQAVDEAGIVSHCIATSTNSRVSYTVFEQSTGREYRFVCGGEPVDEKSLNMAIDHVNSIDCDFLVLSGSLPANAPVDTYARIASMAAKRNIKVVLDCAGEALNMALNSGSVYLVKPSFGELEQLAGSTLDESSAIEFAQTLVKQQKASVVCVSMGRHGAFLCSENITLRSPAVRVKVRSAVGAGDSFMAGVISRLACEESIEDAFRYGIAAGAAAVTSTGIDYCNPVNIKNLVDNVVVSQID